MDSLREILPAPGEMGLALFLPFVRVIAGCAALLAALYLLMGMDQSGLAGNLVVDYIGLALPLAGRVAGFSVFYSIFYLCLGSFVHDLRVAALFVSGLARLWERRALRLRMWSAIGLVRCPFLSLFCPRSWHPHKWLAVGWRAGDSALFVYD